ncbi:MAG: bifunctional riboflavin kinase/FAD synthetase [Actinomycetota bacterium]
MELLQGIASLPAAAGPSVVTVGFFDGVHRGHRAVFRRTVEVAVERGAMPVAVTFDRHPREILTPGREPRLLTTVKRKAGLIEATGIQALLVLEFTEEFSRWSAEEFVRRVLLEGLHADHAVVGANFTFGHRAAGNLEVLQALGAPYGLTAEGVALVELGGRTVSSSSIREALATGDLTWPLEALGRRFVVDGEVVSGAGRGKGLGFPTANLRTWPRLLLPGNGIYAGRARTDGDDHVAAISVGTNPTFGAEPLHVEAYLLDYRGGDLRGEALSVEFWARLRDELRFDSPGELSRAIAEDVERTRELIPAPREG